MTTNNRTAEELLRDMAFVMRMARKVSHEIRSEAKCSAEPKRIRTADAATPVTMGA